MKQNHWSKLKKQSKNYNIIICLKNIIYKEIEIRMNLKQILKMKKKYFRMNFKYIKVQKICKKYYYF